MPSRVTRRHGNNRSRALDGEEARMIAQFLGRRAGRRGRSELCDRGLRQDGVQEAEVFWLPDNIWRRAAVSDALLAQVSEH